MHSTDSIAPFIAQDMEFHTCFLTAEVTFVPGVVDLIYRNIPNDLSTYTAFDQRMDGIISAGSMTTFNTA